VGIVEANYRVTTSADLSGFRQMSTLLDEIDRKARSISATFARMQPASMYTATASGGGTVNPANTGTPQRRQRASNGAPKYDLNTPQGLYQWYQQVYEPEAGVLSQMTTGFQNKLFGGPGRRPRPMLTTVPTTSAPMSESAMNGWFAGLSSNVHTMPGEIRGAYAQAAFNSQSDNTAISNFYRQYGPQLGAPASAGGAGGGGGIPPSSAMGFGAAVGGAAKKYLPWVTMGGAVMYGVDQFKQGSNLWQQSSSPIDALSHSLSTTATNVEAFRQAISTAGAQFGQTLQQSAQSAQMLTQSFGNLTQQNIASLVGSTAQFGYMNGLSPSQSAQIMATSATLGLTQGYGATLSPTQFQGMLNNATTSAGMQGRQGPFYTGLMSSANSVVSQNAMLNNPTYFAGMYAQSVNTMGGMRGGQLFSQLNSGVMGASGYTQGMLFAAMQKTLGGKLGSQDIVNILAAQQGGISSFVPGTHTTVGSSLYGYMKNSGFNQDQQVLMLAPYFGGNINEAKLFLQNSGNFGNAATSTQGNQTPWYSMFGRSQQMTANYQLGQSDLGYATAPLGMATHALGPLGNIAGMFLGMRYGGSLLKGTLASRSLAGGLRAAAGTAGSDVGAASGFLGRLFGSSGGAAFKAFDGSWAGSDASLLSKIAPLAKGIPIVGSLASAGIDKATGGTWGHAAGVGAGAGIGGFLGALVPVPGLDVATSIGGSVIGSWAGGRIANLFGHHAASASDHTSQVRQQSQQRSSSNIGTMTIDNLKINQVTMPGGAGGSLLSNALSAGTAYAPTSGSVGGFSSSTLPSILQVLGNGVTSMLGLGSGWSAPASSADFAKKMLPYAQQISKATGIPANTILGELGFESNGGKSQAAIDNLNFAGIKPFGKYGAGKDSKYAGFSSLDQFAQADIQVLNQSRYAAARNAAKNGASPEVVGKMLAQEGYATDNPAAYGAGVQSWVNALAQAFEQALSRHATKAQATGNQVVIPGVGAIRP